MSWARPAVMGVTPSTRCAHTLTVVGEQRETIYVFGGWDGKRMLADVHVLKIDSMTWTEIFPKAKTGSAPMARGGHSACAYDQRLFVFGGGSGSHFVNDLYILDTNECCWEQVYVAGTSPSPRSRHSAEFIGNRMFVMFGGDDTRVYDDLHVFDASTRTWTEVATKGTRPSARWGHSSCLLGDGRLLVFGGHDGEEMLNDLYILDVETLIWKRLADPIDLPPARAGHTAEVVGSAVVVFGGGDGECLLNDTWLLTLAGDVPSWERALVSGAPPSARCAHTSVSLTDKLLVFGGGDGARRFKDVYILDNVKRLWQASANGSAHAELNAASAASTVSATTTNSGGGLTLSSNKKRHSESLKRSSSAAKHIEGPNYAAQVAQMREFLQPLGLLRYIDTFVAQEVFLDVLPTLTETHLRELGVSTLGARLRLLLAAKALVNDKSDDSKQSNAPLTDEAAIVAAAKQLRLLCERLPPP